MCLLSQIKRTSRPLCGKLFKDGLSHQSAKENLRFVGCAVGDIFGWLVEVLGLKVVFQVL